MGSGIPDWVHLGLCAEMSRRTRRGPLPPTPEPRLVRAPRQAAATSRSCRRTRYGTAVRPKCLPRAPPVRCPGGVVRRIVPLTGQHERQPGPVDENSRSRPQGPCRPGPGGQGQGSWRRGREIMGRFSTTPDGSGRDSDGIHSTRRRNTHFCDRTRSTTSPTNGIEPELSPALELDELVGSDGEMLVSAPSPVVAAGTSNRLRLASRKSPSPAGPDPLCLPHPLPQRLAGHVHPEQLSDRHARRPRRAGRVPAGIRSRRHRLVPAQGHPVTKLRGSQGRPRHRPCIIGAPEFLTKLSASLQRHVVTEAQERPEAL